MFCYRIIEKVGISNYHHYILRGGLKGFHNHPPCSVDREQTSNSDLNQHQQVGNLPNAAISKPISNLVVKKHLSLSHELEPFFKKHSPAWMKSQFFKPALNTGHTIYIVVIN